MKIDNGTGGSRETSTGKPARVDERGRESINLVQRMDGTIELHEMKGGQFMESPDTIRKHDRAKVWCKQRGMKFVILTKK